MKILKSYIALLAALITASSFAFAYDNKSGANHERGMWICETNASSNGFFSNMSNTSNNEANKDAHKDNKAASDNRAASNNANASDEQKRARTAKEAFAFAMKNCKDCTKITCEMQNR